MLLLHTLPDGSAHYDWMIEPAPGATLLTFRLAALFDPAPPAPITPFLAQPLPDHRAIYLHYEGPISGHRGTVRRLWRCPAHIATHAPDHLAVILHAPNAPPRTLTGRPTPDPAHWRFAED